MHEINYIKQKINDLINKKIFTISDLSVKSCLSRPTIYKDLSDKSKKIEMNMVFAASELSKKPLKYFFDDYEVVKEYILNEPESEYENKSVKIELLKQKLLSCTEKIEILEQRIKDKDDIIELLRKNE